MKCHRNLVAITIIIIAALSLLSTAGFSAGVEPELLESISKMQPDDTIRIIIVAADRLSENQHELLRSMGIRIERNFTLAPWYEASMAAGNVYNLQSMDFITQIKSGEYKPLAGEAHPKDDNSTSLAVSMVLLLVALASIVLYLKRKHYKIFILALIAAVILSQAHASYAEENLMPPKLSPLLTGFQEEKNIGLPEKMHPRVSQNKIKTQERKVDSRIIASDNETIRILVETADSYTSSDLRHVKKANIQEFQMGNLIYMEVPKSEINKLEKIDSVKKVQPDKEYKPLLDMAVPLIGTGSFGFIPKPSP